MSEPQDATIEEDEWTDTDSSEVETDTVTFYHKTDLKRKQSLVLTALGLSQADSHQRKRLRLRRDVTSRQDLFNLPRKIRNRIYDHLNFLPNLLPNNFTFTHGDYKDPYNARNLAQTCRQAKAEYDEEFALRLWNHLKHSKALHLSETGCQLMFSRNLASSQDMIGLKSLKAIIKGPIPHSDFAEYLGLPQSIEDLLKLPLHELTFHYTGRYDLPTLRDVQLFFDSIFDQFRSPRQHNAGPRLITLPWNRQEETGDITLIERTFEASWRDPKNAKPCRTCCVQRRSKECLPGELPIGVNATWASLKVGFSENMEVGYCKYKRCSNLPMVFEAQSRLTDAFKISMESRYFRSLVFLCECRCPCRCRCPVEIQAYETEIKYKIGEDE